jgi:hypothetical protein
MKLRTPYNNEILKAALSDSKEIFNSILSSEDLDDEQLAKLEQYNKLPQLHKDLLFLSSQYPVAEIALMYGVSRQYIYRLLNKIKCNF